MEGVSDNYDRTRCQQGKSQTGEVGTGFGVNIEKFETICTLFVVEGEDCFKTQGLPGQKQQLFIRLIDRYVEAVANKIEDGFKISPDESVMIRDFDLAKIPVDEKTLSEQEISTGDCADQREQCHQAAVSSSEEASCEQPDIIQKSSEVFKQQDSFENLTVEQQVERLTQLNGLSPGSLLDRCSVAQRERLSYTPGIPEDCWFAINIRLVEDAIQKHVNAGAEGMFRCCAQNSRLGEAIGLFKTERVAEEVLVDPIMCANIFCRLTRQAEFFSQDNCTKMFDKLYTSPCTSDVLAGLNVVCQQALAQSDNRALDLYKVCMRVIHELLDKAPGSWESAGARLNKLALSKLLAENLFKEITLYPQAVAAPGNADPETLKKDIFEDSSRKQSLLYRLLDLLKLTGHSFVDCE